MNVKNISILSLVFSLSLISACDKSISSSNSISSSSTSEQAKFEEYYDYNWKQGENSLEANSPLIKNPKGESTVINELRRTQNKIGLPSKGEANILVVPISFKDDAQSVLFDKEDIQKINDLYFGKGNSNYPSVSEFYKDSSFDKFNLSGVVTPNITLPKQYTDYLEKYNSSNSNLEAYNEIIEYVYNYLFNETQTYYIGDFDSDNDKNIDAISFIINYSNDYFFKSEEIKTIHKEFSGLNNILFQSDLTKNVPVNSFSFISHSFMNNAYLNQDSRAYISLVGEMIGLDNYQDRTMNPVTSLNRAPLGYLDMMDGLVGDHNVFSKYQLGWIEPKFIKADDISEEGIEVKLNSSVLSNEAIVLHNDKESLFGEYLILDLYSVNGVNELDSITPSLYGKTTFTQSVVRVYQVDSRLVRGSNSIYTPYNGEINFEDKYTLINGVEKNYIYDYAYSNNSVNEYEKYGLNNYPLVSLLSKKGLNRHLMDSSINLTIDDMFLEGDIFGSSDQIDGFYKNFAFHGSGQGESKLNITFEIISINQEEATIIFRREK